MDNLIHIMRGVLGNINARLVVADYLLFIVMRLDDLIKDRKV